MAGRAGSRSAGRRCGSPLDVRRSASPIASTRHHRDCGTYPAECYGWFLAESLKGKGKVEVRRKAGRDLLKLADTPCVELDPALSRTIYKDFPRETTHLTLS